MPTYIKAGFWVETKQKFDHWLNLDKLIQEYSSGIADAPIDGTIYGRQDGTWVVIGGGGGTLQTVLDAGALFSSASGKQLMSVFDADEGADLFTMNSTSEDSIFDSVIQLSPLEAFIKSRNNTSNADIRVKEGLVVIRQYDGALTTNIEIIPPIATTIINFPAKTVGTYTVAMLEDILSLGSLIPTYADNAAAVTGGLAVNKIYKTATGEIRVRV